MAKSAKALNIKSQQKVTRSYLPIKKVPKSYPKKKAYDDEESYSYSYYTSSSLDGASRSPAPSRPLSPIDVSYQPSQTEIDQFLPSSALPEESTEAVEGPKASVEEDTSVEDLNPEVEPPESALNEAPHLEDRDVFRTSDSVFNRYYHDKRRPSLNQNDESTAPFEIPNMQPVNDCRRRQLSDLTHDMSMNRDHTKTLREKWNQELNNMENVVVERNANRSSVRSMTERPIRTNVMESVDNGIKLDARQLDSALDRLFTSTGGHPATGRTVESLQTELDLLYRDLERIGMVTKVRGYDGHYTHIFKSGVMDPREVERTINVEKKKIQQTAKEAIRKSQSEMQKTIDRQKEQIRVLEDVRQQSGKEVSHARLSVMEFHDKMNEKDQIIKENEDTLIKHEGTISMLKEHIKSVSMSSDDIDKLFSNDFESPTIQINGLTPQTGSGVTKPRVVRPPVKHASSRHHTGVIGTIRDRYHVDFQAKDETLKKIHDENIAFQQELDDSKRNERMLEDTIEKLNRELSISKARNTSIDVYQDQHNTFQEEMHRNIQKLKDDCNRSQLRATKAEVESQRLLDTLQQALLKIKEMKIVIDSAAESAMLQEQKLSESRISLDTKQRQILRLEKGIQELKSKHSERLSKYEELFNRSGLLTNKRKESVALIDNLENERDGLIKQLAEKTEEFDVKNSECVEFKIALAKLEATQHVVVESDGMSKEAVDLMRREFDAMKVENQLISSRLTVADAELVGLREAAGTAEEAVDNLQALRQEVTVLETKLADFEKELSDCHAKLLDSAEIIRKQEHDMAEMIREAERGNQVMNNLKDAGVEAVDMKKFNEMKSQIAERDHMLLELAHNLELRTQKLDSCEKQIDYLGKAHQTELDSLRKQREDHQPQIPQMMPILYSPIPAPDVMAPVTSTMQPKKRKKKYTIKGSIDWNNSTSPVINGMRVVT
eukprot:GHVH01004126.1.p1 GENE.GHVH01004126.1~~GHVH01004126.1.p1  ORF type:complete len:948 (+),score=151.19 GHVH01004126.1:283-3126(+)